MNRIDNYKPDPSFRILDCKIHLQKTDLGVDIPEARFRAVTSRVLVVSGYLQAAEFIYSRNEGILSRRPALIKGVSQESDEFFDIAV